MSARVRWLLAAGLVLLVGTLIALGVAGHAAWVAYRDVDPEVGRRALERRLALPSRVFARPLLLRLDESPERRGVALHLEAAGYRRVDTPEVGTGEFYADESRWVIGSRRFAHSEGWDEAVTFSVELGKRGRVAGLRDGDGRPVKQIRLEAPQVGFVHGEDARWAEHVPLDELPEDLLNAFLAIEDHRFYEHRGVDPQRVLGAALANLKAGRIVQGGSTITQQLARNLYLSRERVFSRKLQEAAIAVVLEEQLTKEQILQAYLDEIYLAQRGPLAVHGVGAAARHYFGQDVRDLELHQSALLAALARGPSRYAPHRDPEAALERRNLVLRRMQAVGYLDGESDGDGKPDGDGEGDGGRLEVALGRPLDLRPEVPSIRSTEFFVEHVTKALGSEKLEASLESDQLRIHTTLDWRLQYLAEKAIRDGLEDLETRAPKLIDRDPPVEGALLVMHPPTGDILAMVGGRDFGRSQFNRATQAKRQPGSVFKMVVALAAVHPPDPPFTLASTVTDDAILVPAPEPLPGEEQEEDWEPLNHDEEFRGRVTLREALEESLNIPMVRIGQEVGLERVVETARTLGIRSRLRPVPSIALGTFEVSLLQMTRAYGVLAAGGMRTLPRSWTRVTRDDGESLVRQRMHRKRVFGEDEVYLVTSALEGAVDRGTGKSVRALGYRGPVAGKTGSSDEYRDGWFVGYTPELVVGVWVGFDDEGSLGLPGAYTALPIFTRFLKSALGPRGGAPFEPPPGVYRETVMAQVGFDDGDGGCREVQDWFMAGTAPHYGCGVWDRLPGVGAGPRWPWQRWGGDDEEDDD